MPVKTLPPKISQREAFWFWLKLGFISFGGPAGQIAIMHQELVEHRRWISERRFLHALNYCMLLPGPEAQQLATYLGWLMHRTSGGLIAGGLFVLPSLLILIALSWVYVAFGHLTWIMSLFYGIKPAVAAIVLHAAFRIGSRALKNSWLWMIAACAFIAITILDAPFPLIVLSAAFIGGMGGRFAPRIFALGGGHAPSSRNKKQAQAFEPAVIDDDTPTPEHARLNIQHVVMTGFLGIVIWLASLFLIALLFGWRSPLTLMAWFFTKAALLTFGGAYAVLPYVYQGGVEQYHWLTATQMIDGLALGETTPGPLIMVVTFVGFVGGWSKALFGADSQFLAGAVAATMVTFFTFLPSFMFIFLGGPLVETTHGNLKITAPLTGITAAVVGVIINLAVFFAYHVLWPNGSGGIFEWPSALIGIGAAVAFFRFKAGIIPVILACGAVGMVITLLMR